MALTNIPTGDLRVLIVDNDPLLRQALRDMLVMWGIRQVSTAADGRDAVDRMRNGRFDLLLTDWLMEPMDGEVLVRWVRQAPSSTHRDIPIIVLTGNADLQTVRSAWSAGVDCVLAKPVPANTIARRIEAVLTQPRRATSATSAAPARPTRPGPPPELTDRAGTRKLLPNPSQPEEVPVPATAPSRAMIRLLLALDRLEATLWRAGAGDVRMQHAVNELRFAAAADPATAVIASSLAACLNWSDPDSPDLEPAVRAHIKALHQYAAGSLPAGEIPALVDSLRAMTRHLLCLDGYEMDLPVFAAALPRPATHSGGNSTTPA